MKILAIDTTAKTSSVSIVTEQKILAEYSVNLNLTHSQTIMPMCQNLLSCCQISLQDIDYFAVSSGPGSFTGLRIGLSAVKGMAYALQKPCIAVSTLDALAQNEPSFLGTICAVMDARCQQVYSACYQNDGYQMQKQTADRAILLDELLEELKSLQQPILLVGDGAELCYTQFQSALPNLFLSSEQNRFQRASSVGLLAVKKAQQGELLSAHEIIPQYLRLPQAERERLKKQTIERTTI